MQDCRLWSELRSCQQIALGGRHATCPSAPLRLQKQACADVEELNSARDVARLAGLEIGDPRDGAADVEAAAQQRVRLGVALHCAVLRRERCRVRILHTYTAMFRILCSLIVRQADLAGTVPGSRLLQTRGMLESQ